MFRRFSATLSRLPGLSCRRATQLSAKALDTPLSPGERVEWFCHHLICRTCRNYGGHLRLMRAWFREFGPKLEVPGGLSANCKEEIKARLQIELPGGK